MGSLRQHWRRLKRDAGGMITSAQSAHEVDCAQMRVSHQHFELAMAGDRGNFCDVQAQLEQSADSFVAQIVEVKIIHSSSNAEMLEGEADRVTRYGEHSLSVSTLVCLQLLENRDRAT